MNTPSAILTAAPGMSSNPPTVLVLGAGGRFGAAATLAFAQAGWRVLAQARRTPAALPVGAQHLAVALADTPALVTAAAGARAVVYGVSPLYTRWPTDLLPLAEQGMDVAQRLGATFMLPGNVYNFGSTMPALLHENTPQHADTRNGRLRMQMEQSLHTRTARQGLRSVVIRAGDFFGSGTGSWLDLAIAKDLRHAKLVYPGPLDRAHAWAYLPDLAKAFVAAASKNDLPAAAHWHFAGLTLTGAELLATVQRAAAALGVAPTGPWRQGGLPWTLIRLGGKVWPMWRELAEMAYLWEVPHALDGQALQRDLGPLPVTDADTAMRQALTNLGLGSPATRSATAMV